MVLIFPADIRREALDLAALYRVAVWGISLFQPTRDAERRIAARFGVMLFDRLHAAVPPDALKASLEEKTFQALFTGAAVEACVLSGIALHLQRAGVEEAEFFAVLKSRPALTVYWLHSVAACEVFGLWPWAQDGKAEACPAPS